MNDVILLIEGDYMKGKKELILKSMGASFLISLGNFALLKLGSPIGPVIFAFGLLGVCYLGQNLFTGKCGFFIEDKIPIVDLFIILIVNLISGYVFGLLYSVADMSLIPTALEKVKSWEFSFPFFLKAFLCGTIMYIAVKMYREKTPLGIIFGIPLFIFCGFQHCIANVITLGVAKTMDWSLLLAVIGNFVGSLFFWYLSKTTISAKIRKS